MFIRLIQFTLAIAVATSSSMSFAAARSCVDDLRGGGFPTVDDLIDGLRIVKGRLVGSLSGSRIARVVFQATHLHDVQFIVNDREFYGDMRNAQIFAEGGRKIYLRSNFLNRPDLSWLLHELKHTTQDRKKSLARKIIFVPKNPSKSVTTLLEAYKQKLYRFDELESWIVDLVSASEYPDLNDPIDFAIEQRLLLHYATEWMRVGAPKIGYNIQDGHFKMDVGIRRAGAPDEILGTLWFPSDRRFTSYSEQRDHISKLIATRLSQLDALSPRLQGD